MQVKLLQGPITGDALIKACFIALSLSSSLEPIVLGLTWIGGSRRSTQVPQATEIPKFDRYLRSGFESMIEDELDLGWHGMIKEKALSFNPIDYGLLNTPEHTASYVHHLCG